MIRNSTFGIKNHQADRLKPAASSHPRLSGRLMHTALLATAILFSAVAINSNAAAQPQTSNLFDVPQSLKKRVNFWENIFLKHDSATYLIHDRNQPWLVIDILPFKKLAATKNKPEFLDQQAQKNLTEKYLERYRLALKRFESEGKRALRYGNMEKRVHSVYSQTITGLKDLYNGNARLRYQRGLSDTFMSAAKRAQDYLPYVEREFRNEGVPVELTRLAFVESMFNSKAVSKVGASGMWQFMPATAKSYMKVNSKVDERNSPIKSARAAAKLLRSNYQSLGSWPLAVTGYNHGPSGMKRAVKALNTKDLSKIILWYKKSSFGFASQNFYAEYLAVLRGYNYLVKKGAINISPSKYDMVSVRLQRPIKVKNLSRKLQVPVHDIKRLNRCIMTKTFTKNSGYYLPKNYELFIPRKYTSSLNYNVANLISDKSRG